jgi:hypothetical protein
MKPISIAEVLALPVDVRLIVRPEAEANIGDA